MKTLLSMIAVATLSLAACASTPGSDQRTGAYGEECKATYTSSAAKQIANADKPGVPGSQLEKDYAASRLAQLQLHNPQLRGYGQPNTLYEVLRACN